MKRTALAVLLALLLVSACSGGSKDHNAQDVTFAQGMIPHHLQAVEMSTLASTQASSPKVKDLAGRIKGAQDPEVQMMRGWLSTWDEPETAEGGDMEGMDHGGGTASSGMGMMTDAQLDELRAASGTEFDRMSLTMMAEHHRGAVSMSQVEIEKGKFEPAKQLAGTIITAQQKEITEMQGLLDGGL
jgi:uncharacterized protein (DUF305 family)